MVKKLKKNSEISLVLPQPDGNNPVCEGTVSTERTLVGKSTGGAAATLPCLLLTSILAVGAYLY